MPVAFNPPPLPTADRARAAASDASAENDLPEGDGFAALLAHASHGDAVSVTGPKATAEGDTVAGADAPRAVDPFQGDASAGAAGAQALIASFQALLSPRPIAPEAAFAPRALAADDA